MDDAFNALGTYQWRVGQIYPSPNYIIDAPKADNGTYYHVLHGFLVDMHTTKQVYYHAPDYGWKANMLYPVHKSKPVNLGPDTGQAPTSGIYTGIPSGCGPNGMHGGNPYS